MSKTPKSLNVVSWNVNGIRAAAKSGFFDWLQKSNADVVLLQEVRANLDQFHPDWLEPFGYKGFWHPAQKKGYSGVGVFTRLDLKPQDVVLGTGHEEFDCEGRFMGFTIGEYFVASAYFPNSQSLGARVDYKIKFCEAVFEKLKKLEHRGFKVVLGGDYNIAHQPIDLANPKQNEKNAGYLPQEREWMSHFLSNGFVDTFRMFHQEGGHYSWFKNFPFGLRERNVGWRIDYVCVSEALKERVCAAKIHGEVFGSDHLPVSIHLETT